MYKQLSGPHSDSYRGANGYSGTGGEYNTTAMSSGGYNSNGYWRSSGTYVNLGGAGSWGDGGSHNMQYGSRAGTGGVVCIMLIMVKYTQATEWFVFSQSA